MASIRQDIRQDSSADFLPDFRNLGVLARVLVGVNALVLAAAALPSTSMVQAADRLMLGVTLVEPLLIASLLSLAALSTVLARLSYWPGCAAVLGVVLALTAIMHAVLAWSLGESSSDLGRTLVVSALVTALM